MSKEMPATFTDMQWIAAKRFAATGEVIHWEDEDDADRRTVQRLDGRKLAVGDIIYEAESEDMAEDFVLCCWNRKPFGILVAITTPVGSYR